MENDSFDLPVPTHELLKLFWVDCQHNTSRNDLSSFPSKPSMNPPYILTISSIAIVAEDHNK